MENKLKKLDKRKPLGADYNIYSPVINTLIDNIGVLVIEIKNLKKEIEELKRTKTKIKENCKDEKKIININNKLSSNK